MQHRIIPKLRSNKRLRPERLLLICFFDPSGINTVPENIAYLQQFSRISIDIINFYGRKAPFQFDTNFILANYDVIVFHNTITYSIENISKIDERLKIKLKEYDGLKVIFKQDEQYKANATVSFIEKIKADLVFSCLPANEYKNVYPEKRTNKVQFTRMLTGYVTPKMRVLQYRQTNNRSVDIGYRGSLQPIYFGKLAYEKRQIGDEFVKRLKSLKFTYDISSRWQDRIPGDRWIEFLANCKATLGAESGASIFDLNGEVEKVYKMFIKKYGEIVNNTNWCEEALEMLNIYEGNVKYNQISPRHFEAAATRTVQFLYEGEYSRILTQYKHYFPVKKDFSNFEEIISVIENEKKRIDITDCAFEEVILNSENWVETFAENFDNKILQCLENKRGTKNYYAFAKPSQINVLLICSHQSYLDPRIKWIVDNAPKEMRIHVLGLKDYNTENTEKIERNGSGGFTIEVYKRGNRNKYIIGLEPIINLNNQGSTAISYLTNLINMPKYMLRKHFGISKSEQRYGQFVNYLEHFVDSSSALTFHGMRFTNIDVIIASDLDTLSAGGILKDQYNAKLIYDAHEFWPENDIYNKEWEKEFWISFEKYLLELTDARTTVSEHLAKYMTKLYGYKFASVPNAEPLHSVPHENTGSLVQDNCSVTFIYQGNYAPGRGLKILIETWHETDNKAKLFLRGRENSYLKVLKKSAKSSGILNKRIFFLDPVSEDELIKSAKMADVGLIPYEPVCINHKYCCPNKLSQYCQAGIPILANNTEFVSENINKNKLGIVVDFNKKEDLINAVNYFTNNQNERNMAGKRSLEFAAKQFNWEIVSSQLYSVIKELSESKRNKKDKTNITHFTPEIAIEKEKRSIIKNRMVYPFIYPIVYNPNILSKYLLVPIKYVWRLLPLSVKSKFLSWLNW